MKKIILTILLILFMSSLSYGQSKHNIGSMQIVDSAGVAKWVNRILNSKIITSDTIRITGVLEATDVNITGDYKKDNEVSGVFSNAVNLFSRKNTFEDTLIASTLAFINDLEVATDLNVLGNIDLIGNLSCLGSLEGDGSLLSSLNASSINSGLLNTELLKATTLSLGDIVTVQDVSGTNTFKPMNIGEYALTDDTVRCNLGAIFTVSTGTDLHLFIKNVQEKSFTVVVTNTTGGTVSFDAVSPYEVKWAGDVAPTLTSGNKYDIFTFIVHGNYISGTAVQNFTP
jgi:hypothetical protein